MKTLVLTRIYSGLAESLHGGVWQPTGVPAVYRLLEALASRDAFDTQFVFIARDPDTRFCRILRREIPPLGRVWILPWRQYGRLECPAIGAVLREVEQLLCVLLIALMHRPTVIYATNGVFIAAGILARLRLAPTVLRFLGIFQAQRDLAEKRGSIVARWLYRSPFARAICTQDGSGGEYYLPRLLKSRTPLNILLNGVTRITGEGKAVLRARLGFSDRPVILFLGRLESYKGGSEFIAALTQLHSRHAGGFDAIVVGDGPLMQELRDRVARTGLENCVRFTGAIKHAEVGDYLLAADIYVSLNKFGNLSNANLEALTAGCCMIMLAADPEQHIDLDTVKLIPDSVALRIPRSDISAALAAELARLIENPDEIRWRGQAAANLARTLLTDWNTRIKREIDMLQSAAGVIAEEIEKRPRT